MIFVVGGAYQGKGKYVEKNFNSDYRVIADYHLKVREQISHDLDPLLEVEEFIKESKLTEAFDRLVIISEDVGSGLVPVDSFERLYREMVGRVNCFIAGEAEQVVRVICGVGTRIK